MYVCVCGHILPHNCVGSFHHVQFDSTATAVIMTRNSTKVIETVLCIVNIYCKVEFSSSSPRPSMMPCLVEPNSLRASQYHVYTQLCIYYILHTIAPYQPFSWPFSPPLLSPPSSAFCLLPSSLFSPLSAPPPLPLSLSFCPPTFPSHSFPPPTFPCLLSLTLLSLPFLSPSLSPACTAT